MRNGKMPDETVSQLLDLVAVFTARADSAQDAGNVGAVALWATAAQDVRSVIHDALLLVR